MASQITKNLFVQQFVQAKSLDTFYFHFRVFIAPPLPCEGAGRWKHENDNKTCGKRLWEGASSAESASMSWRHDSSSLRTDAGWHRLRPNSTGRTCDHTGALDHVTRMTHNNEFGFEVVCVVRVRVFWVEDDTVLHGHRWATLSWNTMANPLDRLPKSFQPLRELYAF